MNRSVFSNVTALQAQLAGSLVPAAPVPFDSDGRLHAAGHQSYLRYMSSQPIAGVAVWAHTGRGLTLDAETARQVLQEWRSALPEKIVIAGVGATGTTNPERATALTINMAERAAKMGADGLLVYPPTWLRHHHLCDQLTIVHHRRVSEVGLPMILFYLYEAAGGISYSSTVLDELLGIPQVLGIKVATLDSVMTYQTISRELQERHPDKLLITGEDRFLGYSLRRGARAALVGLGAICCELQADLIRANEAGNTDRFLELSDAVDMLAESIFISPMEGYIKRILWALVHLGVIPLAAANDPWAPEIPPSQFDEIGRRLAALTSEAQVN
jgi:4-hydroxy-tetrahydrodipicolinate synthase